MRQGAEFGDSVSVWGERGRACPANSRDVGHGDPNAFSSAEKKWTEFWEMGAEVRKGKDQDDRGSVLPGSWVDVDASLELGV